MVVNGYSPTPASSCKGPRTPHHAVHLDATYLLLRSFPWFCRINENSQGRALVIAQSRTGTVQPLASSRKGPRTPHHAVHLGADEPPSPPRPWPSHGRTQERRLSSYAALHGLAGSKTISGAYCSQAQVRHTCTEMSTNYLTVCLLRPQPLLTLVIGILRQLSYLRLLSLYFRWQSGCE